MVDTMFGIVVGSEVHRLYWLGFTQIYARRRNPQFYLGFSAAPRSLIRQMAALDRLISLRSKLVPLDLRAYRAQIQRAEPPRFPSPLFEVMSRRFVWTPSNRGRSNGRCFRCLNRGQIQ